MKMNNSINFSKLNCNLSLYTYINRIYPFTVNVYKNFVHAMFDKPDQYQHSKMIPDHASIYVKNRLPQKCDCKCAA